MSIDGTAAPGPGARLKRAREARELDQQEVADVLNLSARTVGLLEAEAWSQLPRPAFTRGYLRTFARLVGENADEILDLYARAGGGDGGGVDLKRADLEGRGLAEVIHKQPGAVLSVAVVAAVLVAGVVLWSVWPDENTQTRDSTARRPPARAAERSLETGPAPRVATTPAPADVTEAPPSVAAREPEVIAPSPTPDPRAEERVPAERSAAPPEAAVVNVDIDLDGEELTTIVEDLAPVARVRRITPDGSDTLSFTFSGDCWVEVKNGEGENLYSDLSRAGDSLELIGEGPFRLRLGYAPGVELAFNREPVVLTPHTRNNIASLVLGQ